MERMYKHFLVDIHQRAIRPVAIQVRDKRIVSIDPCDPMECKHYALPGLVDAHVHIESSMMLPTEFARLAVRHGTVATVSDPHEIANVCGLYGVHYMIQNARKTALKIHFGAPSCVPATSFETAGAVLGPDEVAELLASDDIFYLSEMMNYPGVLYGDADVMKKIASAKASGKPVDGHAPGLRGEDILRYVAAGISTDHECTTYEEAVEKCEAGMYILIREGSAAKNFDALISLMEKYPERIMFCCDDKHPDELLMHHINHHVKRALALGYNLYDVLRAACLHPVQHYQLPVGLLRVGDWADFIVVDDLSAHAFHVQATYINGECVYDGACKLESVPEEPINQFSCNKTHVDDFRIVASTSSDTIRVIRALESQLLTETKLLKPKCKQGFVVSDIDRDLLMLSVVNRYHAAKPAMAMIQGIGLKQGAIASTVAHDSHNIIAVGVDENAIAAVVNALIETKGGIAVSNDSGIHVMPLPVAGIMSHVPAEQIATEYARLDTEAKRCGSPLQAPFMTLSFMALLVIPELKLSDKGLFSAKEFNFTTLYETT